MPMNMDPHSKPKNLLSIRGCTAEDLAQIEAMNRIQLLNLDLVQTFNNVKEETMHPEEPPEAELPILATNAKTNSIKTKDDQHNFTFDPILVKENQEE